MIIKIKSHKREAFQKILEYMMDDKGRLLDKEKSTFTITHNLKGKTINEWVKQYKGNELLRTRKRKDSVRLTHEILSWHREDAKHLTLNKMEELTREYIRQRNPNGIFVAVPHFDKDHYHIHICASGVEYKTGKSLRLSKIDLQKLKKEIQDYQVEKFPELSKSVVAHDQQGKTLLSEGEYQLKKRTGRETNKRQVIEMLKACFKKANSKDLFFELIQELNLNTYERNGETKGIIFKDYKFRFSNLGYTEEHLNELDRLKIRVGGLQTERKKNIERVIER